MIPDADVLAAVQQWAVQVAVTVIAERIVTDADWLTRLAPADQAFIERALTFTILCLYLDGPVTLH